MDKIKGLAVTALLALTLAGCAGQNTAPSADSPQPDTAQGATETPTAQPLVAETPDASDADQRFLDYVRSELLPTTQIANATDEQLIAAGQDGCEQIKAGVPVEDIRLVEGEQPTSGGYYIDTSTLISGAQFALCPETIRDMG